MDLYGIILAAGSSSRMGRTKALLDFKGETFVDRIRRLLKPYCRKVMIVGALDAPFADIVNPDPSRGMLSSLQCGFAAIPAEASGALFTLVDLPAIDASTVSLLSAVDPSTRLAIPRFQGRNGHPVFVNRDLFEEFLAADPTDSPKAVVARHALEILYLDCNDSGIVRDADTPESYRELIANV